jgi:hypothetical protein
VPAYFCGGVICAGQCCGEAMCATTILWRSNMCYDNFVEKQCVIGQFCGEAICARTILWRSNVC